MLFPLSVFQVAYVNIHTSQKFHSHTIFWIVRLRFTGSTVKLQQVVWGSGSESERNRCFKRYADQWNASLFHFRGLILDDVFASFYNQTRTARLLEEFARRSSLLMKWRQQIQNETCWCLLRSSDSRFYNVSRDLVVLPTASHPGKYMASKNNYECMSLFINRWILQDSLSVLGWNMSALVNAQILHIMTVNLRLLSFILCLLWKAWHILNNKLLVLCRISVKVSHLKMEPVCVIVVIRA